MSITWEEERIEFDFRPWSSTATRIGYCQWSEITELLETCFPVPVVLGTTITSGFGIKLPGYDFLRADSIHIEPLSEKIVGPLASDGTVDTDMDFDTIVEFEKAKCVIKYATFLGSVQGTTLNEPFNPDPVLFLEHKLAMGCEFLQIPSEGLQWKNNTSSPVPDGLPIGIRIPTTEHSITWPFISFPPWTAMRNTIGKVNSSAITFQTGLISAECLMFMGMEASRQITSDGTTCWNVTYRFSEKQTATTGTVITTAAKGWNVFYNPVTQTFDIIVKSDGTTRIYDTTNFLNLFQVSMAG